MGKQVEKKSKAKAKKYPGKGRVELRELYVEPLGKKDTEPVEVDGEEFMILLVKDKDAVAIERYDFLKLVDVRMDAPGGRIRIYPAMGCKKIVYDYEKHSIESVREKKSD